MTRGADLGVLHAAWYLAYEREHLYAAKLLVEWGLPLARWQRLARAEGYKMPREVWRHFREEAA